MKQKLTLLILCMNGLLLNAQTPQLVVDYNPGSESTFDIGFFEFLQMDDYVLVTISNPTHGVELGILRQGMLSLLKDIYPGENGSRPKDFIALGEKVLFTATTNDDEGLWVTDGTEEGTVLLFDPGTSEWDNVSNLVKSSTDEVYFSNSDLNILYKTDGTIITELGAGTLRDDYNSATAQYCAYKDGIAFISEDDNVFSIKMTDGVTIETLGTIEAKFSTDSKGLFTIEDGLIMGLGDSADEFDGLFFYNENDKTLNEVPEGILSSGASRYIQLSPNVLLGSERGEGVFKIENNGQHKLIFDGEVPRFFGGESQQQLTVGERTLFYGYEDFIDKGFIISDGTLSGTRIAFKSRSQVTHLVRHNNYGFTASGTGNGFPPEIHYYNFSTDETDELFSINAQSLSPGSILLLGVQDSKLFFGSSLDPAVGHELFSYDVSSLEDLEVSNDIVLDDEIDFKIYNGGFELNRDRSENYNVRVYNVGGQLLESYEVQSNEFYAFGDVTGILFLQIEIDGQFYSVQTFNY